VDADMVSARRLTGAADAARGKETVMARFVGISLALGSLLLCSTAQADYTSPSRVDAIEQAASSVFGGAAFVKLATVRCPFRNDGFFVLRSDPKQQQQLDMLLTARSSGFRVTLSFSPPSCDLATVGLCPNTGPC
jgi:hypothetical protein